VTRPHDDSMLELAALRAVDALEAADAAAIDAHLAQCALCRAEFHRAAAAGTALAFAAASAPPESLRQRVLASAVRVRRLRPWYQHPALPAGIAAAVVLAVSGTWIAQHRSAPESQWAAACVPASAGCGGEVTSTAGLLRLDAHGLPALPPGKVYQAWIIHPKQAPVPEPTFTTTADGNGSVEMSAAAGKGDTIAVTVEPAGGSKAPTSQPLVLATID
jgi:anti-sigma-K factor RskA